MKTDQPLVKPKSLNVLSIDGGGIRGIIPALLLAEIEARTGKPICQLFDSIAGTSTGGILALGLSKPKSAGSMEPAFAAAELVAMYENEGRTIFPKSSWGSLGNLFRAAYPASGIEKVLEHYFGDARLKDALTPVIITSYELEGRSAWFFRSKNAQILRIQATYDYPMKQVARATSAAPTYFAPAAIPNGETGDKWALVDGGVFANNPAMCAYVEALQHAPGANICVVSLGTGEAPQSGFAKQASRWGVVNWARPLIAITMDGPGDTVHYQLDKLLKQDYYRLQPKLENVSDAMDNTDPANIKRLKELTQAMIAAQDEEIDKACSRLLENKFYPLSNIEIAEGCGISSQAAASLLRGMNLPPDLYCELWVGSEKKPRYAPAVLAMAQAANANRTSSGQGGTATVGTPLL